MNSNRSHLPDDPIVYKQSTKVCFTSRRARGTGGRGRISRGRRPDTVGVYSGTLHMCLLLHGPPPATTHSDLTQGDHVQCESARLVLLYRVPRRASRPVSVDCDRSAQQSTRANRTQHGQEGGTFGCSITEPSFLHNFPISFLHVRCRSYR